MRAAIPAVVTGRGAFIFISSVGADMTAAGGAPVALAEPSLKIAVAMQME